MRVGVERLTTETVLSTPEPPPQCDPLPRRLPAVDTGSKEPGTLRRSPAIGTGSDEPGVSGAETSTEREGIIPLQTSVDGFASPVQEGAIILLQSDVGVNDDKYQPTTLQHATAREEFAIARPTKERQHQRMIEQSKQFDPGGQK